MAESLDSIVRVLTNPTAHRIYESVKDLPIVDYHCHLSPREIYEDKPFDNIGDMWLGGDHYKWRLMRFAGVDESLITGDVSPKERFDQFFRVVCKAYGNPIRDWAKLELAKFFDVTIPLVSENSEAVWNAANAVIREQKLSPRKLMRASKVEYVATTDEVCDDLAWHFKLKTDFPEVRVAPAFRTDKLFAVDKPQYSEYLAKLSEVSGVNVVDAHSLSIALEARLRFFVSAGCAFSDVGAEGFPVKVATDDEATAVLKKALNGVFPTADEVDAYRGYLYFLLGGLYKKYDVVQQWHLGSKRNVNSLEFARLGPDTGYDISDNCLDVHSLAAMLDRLNKAGTLPKTVIYTLNPQFYYPLITTCGAFRDVVVGVSWWFADHKRGMREYLEQWSELANLGSMVGMLTDSRSFLSYTRHDYFRQILSEFLSDCVTEDEIPEAIEVATNICYNNAAKLVKRSS